MQIARRTLLALATLAALAACAREAAAPAQGAKAPDVVNVYSSRHYDVDKKLYAAFEADTGVRVQTIEARGEQLLERMKAEGDQSPADLIVTVDAGNLFRLQEQDLLKSAVSPALTSAVPAELRDPQGHWFGLSKRYRVIAYAKGKVDPANLASYDVLASPAFKGRVCVRSSTNIYNLSFLAAKIERQGPGAALSWAKGVVANMAREPQGGDTDQLKAIAGGVCDVALVNHYYLLRMARSADPAETEAAAKIGLVFPEDGGAGAHVNISGMALARYTKNEANAVRLMEFLVSPKAQAIIAEENEEFPILASAPKGAALTALGAFTEDKTPLTVLGARQREAQTLYDQAGWR